MKDINATIANRISKYRAESGLTLKELAEKVGITEATMQKYEAGKIQRIDVDMIKRMATALSVAPEQLTGWEVSIDVPNEFRKSLEQYLHLSAYKQKLVKELIDGLSKESE